MTSSTIPPPIIESVSDLLAEEEVEQEQPEVVQGLQAEQPEHLKRAPLVRHSL
jgi:hypothetical protein